MHQQVPRSLVMATLQVKRYSSRGSQTRTVWASNRGSSQPNPSSTYETFIFLIHIEIDVSCVAAVVAVFFFLLWARNIALNNFDSIFAAVLTNWLCPPAKSIFLNMNLDTFCDWGMLLPRAVFCWEYFYRHGFLLQAKWRFGIWM